MLRARLIGIAKPSPAPGPERTRVLMPITSPSALSSGPPELPGLIAASVWIRSKRFPEIPSWATLRLRLLMMPIVTVFSNPKGLPTAIAQSPTLNRSESPRAAVGQGPLPSNRTTARSVRLSLPTTLAATLRPSVSPT